jgi:hypothetical protein
MLKGMTKYQEKPDVARVVYMKDHSTLLHFAAKVGSVKLVQLVMLSGGGDSSVCVASPSYYFSGADLEEKEDAYGLTPLFTAVHNRHLVRAFYRLHSPRLTLLARML